MHVIIMEDGYSITINEEWHKFYYQHMLPSHIDNLTIGGDVLVNIVVVEELEEEDEEGDEYEGKEDVEN
ncbi:hypothetical protein L3Y34_012289 [Caenorhabditis briggsae]|uniref:Galectin n=1 Tax=Caenorhabditis briggsae TaxID=6238 RepID=A0AAE8ZYL1_CAEBR|nr:hypothetical protein L3Y34_012289 [Caenorhabditis briggsae]